MRIAGLLHELSLVYGLGQAEVESAFHAQPKTRKQLQGAPLPLTDDLEARLKGWTLHEKLIDDAVQGYTRFRTAVERVAGNHSATFAPWTKRVQSVDNALRWARQVQEAEGQMAPGARALAELRGVLVQWKLAPPAGEAPLLGPFAAGLALGLEQSRRWYGSDGPVALRVVPGLGGGTFLQGLGDGRLWGRHGGVASVHEVAALGLKVVLPGHGRVGQYQLQDAQWWVLVHIGGVNVTKVAREANKTYQELQPSFKNTARALGFRKG